MAKSYVKQNEKVCFLLGVYREGIIFFRNRYDIGPNEFILKTYAPYDEIEEEYKPYIDHKIFTLDRSEETFICQDICEQVDYKRFWDSLKPTSFNSFLSAYIFNPTTVKAPYEQIKHVLKHLYENKNRVENERKFIEDWWVKRRMKTLFRR